MISFGLPNLRFPALPFARARRSQSLAKASGRAVPVRVVPGTHAPTPGARLGRYELLSPLAAGGMAEVHKARAVGPGGFQRTVVIKRILPGQAQDEEFVKMFMDEAKILGMLHHPNVVQAYDFGEDNGSLFLALEYVDGPSVSRILRTLRASGRKLSPAIAAYIAREVCQALAYVHDLADAKGNSLNVIHRDVTPSNIVLTATGAVKLLDFGVAKFNDAQQATKAGTVKGKPAYLAPEQLEGKVIDGRVDLFSLGIVLHEMLSLEHLFAGDSDLVTIKKIMEMEIPVPSAKRPDVGPELDRIVMRALERDRRKRYASAAEMARDLDNFIVASQLRLDEVATFIAQLEEEAHRQTVAHQRSLRRVTPPPLPLEALGGVLLEPSRKDLGLALRMWTLGELFWCRRPRGTLLAGILLVVMGAAAALGPQINVTTSRNVAQAAAPGSPATASADTRGAAAAPVGERLFCPAEAELR